MKRSALSAFASLAVLLNISAPSAADDGQQLLTMDHYVRVASAVPAIAGQPAQIYVRERVSAGVALRGAAGPDRVVLFVHGAGTPAEVAFDPPIGDTAGWPTWPAPASTSSRWTRPATGARPGPRR